MSPQKTQLHAIVKGKVQGVGFRWTVVEYAQKRNLTGTVRNIPDGTVEILAQGAKANLEAFLQDLQSDSGLAKIDSITTRFSLPSLPLSTFTIES